MDETRTRILKVESGELQRLLSGDHHDPHAILGAHAVAHAGEKGLVVRAFHPDAEMVECIFPDSEPLAMSALGDSGVFALYVREGEPTVKYRLRFHFAGGQTWEREDPYRFLPTLGDVDLHLFNEGTHRHLWRVLGAHPRQINGTDGVAFAVWAPNARRVSVVGDFCRWDGRLFPMRSLGASGIYELFIPGLSAGALYKYEIKTRDGNIRLKTDPFAASMEVPPSTASRVYQSSYRWGDEDWVAERSRANHEHEPLAIYELHLGSWARVPEEGNRPLTYREIAPKLVDHVKRFGFTHIELLPVAEHPFAGSWGYQVSGYYAPTSRYGTPDDFRYLIDTCHQNGIGVIFDWVPAHFPKDDFALRLFDGTALYEHADPRLGEHPDWGTLVFNFGRKEVANFLIANALYWFEEFHIDGLRVDAVASMLYLDYSREEGQWIPNIYGGRENLEAVDFLKRLNGIVAAEQPGCMMIAEESTAWPGVSRPTTEGGLGFSFKWNMGWMHDTLEYFKKDPVHRRWHLDQLSFAMIYEYSERFVMPLSHDEVVHGKGSLLARMPGDDWQKLANLRTLLAYQYTRPGKILLFMGTELAPFNEWHHDSSLDWHLADDPRRADFARFLSDLGSLYLSTPPLWRRDTQPDGFSWIDCSDRDNSVLAYIRHADDDHVVVVLNLTPVPRDDYRIGVPAAARYRVLLSSDDRKYGGSEHEVPEHFDSEAVSFHGRPHSLNLSLPPLGALILAPQG